MDEKGWLSAARPGPMLARLHGRASERKLWLFACACCRRHGRLLPDPRSRRALEALERFADGRASSEEMTEAARAAHAAGLRARSSRRAAEAAQKEGGKAGWWERERAARDAAQREGAAWLAWQMACRDREAMLGAAEFAADVAAEADAEAKERQAQAEVLRDLFGNPFHSAAVAPAVLAWNDGAIRKMAQVIYDGRAFDRLPLLADALEEAGCTDAAILGHCRGGGEHVRGCWVVDALLCRE